MAKVTFEFNPDTEHEQLDAAYKAARLTKVVNEFRDFLRLAVIYHDPSLGYGIITLEKIKDDFENCLKKHGL